VDTNVILDVLLKPPASRGYKRRDLDLH